MKKVFGRQRTGQELGELYEFLTVRCTHTENNVQNEKKKSSLPLKRRMESKVELE